jgi:hypothetical protein
VSLENLPYPLPFRRGFGSVLVSVIPPSLQVALRQTTDRFFGERHKIEVTFPTLRVPLGPFAPKQVRVGLLGDFHYDPLREAQFVARCIELTNRLEPDVIFLLGDYASEATAFISELAAELANLKPSHGCFAILGNHDHLAGHAEVHQALQENGLLVLRNEAVHVPFENGARLAVAGFDSATYRCPDFGCLDRFAPEERAIILCHEPDVFVHASEHLKTALQLSGHTHGGQVWLPGLGSPLLPRLGKRYIRGHYNRNAAQLYVNRGIGTGHLHVRFGARPEITLLTLINSSR